MTRVPLLIASFAALLAALPVTAADPPDEVAALQKRLDKLEAENAALKKELADVKQALAPLLKLPKESVEKAATEEKIKALGKELSEDLVQGRLAAVYDSTSAAFRKTTDRKMFEERMKKDPGYKVFVATADEKKPTEVTRVKAGQKPQKWNWYYTRTVSYGFNTYRVNVAVTFIEEDGEWKVDSLDLTRDDS